MPCSIWRIASGTAQAAALQVRQPICEQPPTRSQRDPALRSDVEDKPWFNTANWPHLTMLASQRFNGFQT